MSKILKAAAGAAALLLAGPTFAAWEVNMRPGVTELSRDIHGLHMLIFWVCVAIAIVVFSAMIYSIATFRKSKGAVADTTITHSAKVEVIWTVVPIAILVGMAIPAAETLVRIEDTRASDITVKVTGYQWKWQYEYLAEKVSFFSTLARTSNAARQVRSNIDVKSIPNYLLEVDNPLVVPVGKKVRVLVTASDVIHAWWVPDFGMKKDAIPGFVNELWFRAEKPGIYRGQCTELCGRDHAFMPIVVEVKTQADYDAWLKQRQAGAQAPATAQAQPAASETQTAPVAVAKAE